MILNAIRAHFAEFGIIAAQGPRKVVELILRLREDNASDLPETARSALQALAVQLDSLCAAKNSIAAGSRRVQISSRIPNFAFPQ